MEWRILLLLAIHFCGDFLLQNWLPGDLARRKASDFNALLIHTVTYSLCFLGFGLPFALTTFVLHTATDAVTSGTTSKYWFIRLTPLTDSVLQKEGFTHLAKVFDDDRAVFFNAIGFDQLLHAAQLIGTLWLLK